MPKSVFWPLAVIIMALFFLALHLQLLPDRFADFWYVLFILVGLGGLLTSDRDEWMVDEKKASSAKKAAPVAAKTTSKKKAASKKTAVKKAATKKKTTASKKSSAKKSPAKKK